MITTSDYNFDYYFGEVVVVVQLRQYIGREAVLYQAVCSTNLSNIATMQFFLFMSYPVTAMLIGFDIYSTRANKLKKLQTV